MTRSRPRARLRFVGGAGGVPDHVRPVLPLARETGLHPHAPATGGGRLRRPPPVLDLVQPSASAGDVAGARTRRVFRQSRLVYDGAGTPGLVGRVRDGPLAAHLPTMARAEVVTCTSMGEALELGGLGVAPHRLHVVPTLHTSLDAEVQDRARRLMQEARCPAERLVVVGDTATRLLHAEGPPPSDPPWHLLPRHALGSAPDLPLLRALVTEGVRLVTSTTDRRTDPWLAVSAGRRPLLLDDPGRPTDDGLDRLDACHRLSEPSWTELEKALAEPDTLDPRLVRLARGRHSLEAVAPRWVHAIASATGT